MIISKSNFSSESNLTSNFNHSSVLDNIKKPNFDDFFYTVMSGSITLSYTFSSRNIEYIAITSNIAKKESIEIKINNNVVTFEGLAFDETHVLMFDFLDMNLSNSTRIDVKINGYGDLFILNIAFGELYKVKLGGQSGRNLAWSIPNVQLRQQQINQIPIAGLYESREIKSGLTIPNNFLDEYGDYNEMLNFISSSSFYVREDEEIHHSSLCSNAKITPSQTHSSARSLLVSKIEWNAFSKGVEVRR